MLAVSNMSLFRIPCWELQRLLDGSAGGKMMELGKEMEVRYGELLREEGGIEGVPFSWTVY